MKCNPDYHGPLLCRFDYWGASACVRRRVPHVDPVAPDLTAAPGRAACLMDIAVLVRRDWLLLGKRK